jgi:hypothetical protein
MHISPSNVLSQAPLEQGVDVEIILGADWQVPQNLAAGWVRLGGDRSLHLSAFRHSLETFPPETIPWKKAGRGSG